MDVESRPPHVSSSRRPALTSVADTRGGKFAEEKRKRSLRAGREYEKKKDSTDTCPVFCVPETVEKRGRRRRRERRRNSRSVIFIAVSDFARLPSLEGHPVFTFRGERSSCPRRGGEGNRGENYYRWARTHESKMSPLLKIFSNSSKVESIKYLIYIFVISMFGIFLCYSRNLVNREFRIRSKNFLLFDSLHRSRRDASRPLLSRHMAIQHLQGLAFMDPSSSHRHTRTE